MPVICINQGIPNKYVTAHPANMADNSTLTDRPKRSIIMPVTNAHKMKLIINPPTGVARVPIPPDNPEKTGIPAIPSITKIIWLKVPSFVPNNPAAVNIEKCVKVIGAGPRGIDVCDKTALNAAKKAHRVISLVSIFFICIHTL